jgi:LuxR family maltose regulon positive regulatory protein
MPIPLLKTKLYIPPVRPEWVQRPRLLERLSAGLDRRLTFVSAPAGSGKTTLVSAWLHGVQRPCAWLSLDEADNDPSRFLAYLVAVLENLDPSPESADRIGRSVESLLEASPSPLAEPVLTFLINDIDAIGAPFVLVLEDYHAISTPAIHSAVAFLLERQPPHAHLVIITRHDPPLPLSRLRGRDQVTEIRQDDLRFSREETGYFLQQAMGLELTDADITTLEKRTEGWITGLQLAALALQGRDEKSVTQFVEGFSGRYHFVLDYLTDEVLKQQPELVQQFLLQTSILERMCSPLCNALVQVEESEDEDGEVPPFNIGELGEETLHRLETENLFVVPLDDERRWYRYHKLFAELLQVRLQESAPALIPELHRRAAVWYERNAFPAEAVRHALATSDYDLAAAVIERAITQVATWSRLDVGTLLGWLNALPAGVMRARPLLRLFAVRAMFSAGQTDTAERFLNDLEDALLAEPSIPDSEQLLRTILADRGSYAVVHGDVSQAIDFTQRFLAQVRENDSSSQIRGAAILGMAHLRAGELAHATQAFRQAIDLALAVDLPIAAVPLLCNLADVQSTQGQLNQAAQTLEQAIQIGTVEGKRTASTGFAGLGLGKILYERNDLREAERHILDGLALVSDGGIAEFFGNMHAVLARVRQAKGESQAAQAAMQFALQLAQRGGILRISVLAAAYQARIWLAQGKVSLAVQWGRDYRRAGEVQFTREFEDLTLACVLLADGQPHDALALLDGMLAPAQSAGRMGSVVEILALRALALQSSGVSNQPVAALEAALSLAEPQGYVRTFLDLGEPMGSLLKQVAGRGIQSEYASRLLAAFDAQAHVRTEGSSASELFVSPPHQPLVEPLTPREIEVLYLLAGRLSNAEIAHQLVISLPTVKSHTRSIYGKLSVHDRKAAVLRARELGILSSSAA